MVHLKSSAHRKRDQRSEKKKMMAREKRCELGAFMELNEAYSKRFKSLIASKETSPG
jgi:hypothetical protein